MMVLLVLLMVETYVVQTRDVLYFAGVDKSFINILVQRLLGGNRHVDMIK
jgi:hypothetical protein